MIRSNTARVCGDERGYTLPEILTAVSIMSIILAIGIIVLLALLERWRVEAAADQFAADLRLAHTRATEQRLTGGWCSCTTAPLSAVAHQQTTAWSN